MDVDVERRVLREKNQSDVYKRLSYVLNIVKNHPSAWPFLCPVDVIEVVDYLDIVKVPMDFSVVESKLLQRLYVNEAAFIDDIRLIFSNCRAYNKQDTVYYTCADMTEQAFDAVMVDVKKSSSPLASIMSKSSHGRSKKRRNDHNMTMNLCKGTPKTLTNATGRVKTQCSINCNANVVINESMSTAQSQQLKKKRMDFVMEAKGNASIFGDDDDDNNGDEVDYIGKKDFPLMLSDGGNMPSVELKLAEKTTNVDLMEMARQRSHNRVKAAHESMKISKVSSKALIKATKSSAKSMSTKKSCRKSTPSQSLRESIGQREAWGRDIQLNTSSSNFSSDLPPTTALGLLMSSKKRGSRISTTTRDGNSMSTSNFDNTAPYPTAQNFFVWQRCGAVLLHEHALTQSIYRTALLGVAGNNFADALTSKLLNVMVEILIDGTLTTLIEARNNEISGMGIMTTPAIDTIKGDICSTETNDELVNYQKFSTRVSVNSLNELKSVRDKFHANECVFVRSPSPSMNISTPHFIHRSYPSIVASCLPPIDAASIKGACDLWNSDDWKVSTDINGITFNKGCVDSNLVFSSSGSLMFSTLLPKFDSTRPSSSAANVTGNSLFMSDEEFEKYIHADMGIPTATVRSLMLWASLRAQCKNELNKQWPDKYRPLLSGEVLGEANAGEVRFLRFWLGAWQTRLTGKEVSHTNSNSTELQEFLERATCYKSNNGVDYENNERSDIQLINTMLLSGPCGTGKTAAVMACAEELGFHVLELNAGQNRSGRGVRTIVGEASISRQIDGNWLAKDSPNSSEEGCSKGQSALWKSTILTKSNVDNAVQFQSTALPEDDDFVAEVEKSSQIKRNNNHIHVLSDSDDEVAEEACSALMEASTLSTPKQDGSLLLMEEVDIWFQEDAGFWVSIGDIMATAKRPIVLICSDVDTSVALKQLSLLNSRRFVTCNMHTSSENELILYLRVICRAEGRPDFSLTEWKRVVRHYQHDIRRLLLLAQFWTIFNSEVYSCNNVENELSSLLWRSLALSSCKARTTIVATARHADVNVQCDFIAPNGDLTALESALEHRSFMDAFVTDSERRILQRHWHDVAVNEEAHDGDRVFPSAEWEDICAWADVLAGCTTLSDANISSNPMSIAGTSQLRQHFYKPLLQVLDSTMVLSNNAITHDYVPTLISIAACESKRRSSNDCRRFFNYLDRIGFHHSDINLIETQYVPMRDQMAEEYSRI